MQDANVTFAAHIMHVLVMTIITYHLSLNLVPSKFRFAAHTYIYLHILYYVQKCDA